MPFLLQLSLPISGEAGRWGGGGGGGRRGQPTGVLHLCYVGLCLSAVYVCVLLFVYCICLFVCVCLFVVFVYCVGVYLFMFIYCVGVYLFSFVCVLVFIYLPIYFYKL